MRARITTTIAAIFNSLRARRCRFIANRCTSAGAGAIGAGTVAIPGVVWNAQISELIFNNLIAQQAVVQRGFGLEVTRNDVLLQVAVAYQELLRAEGTRAVAIKNRDDTKEVARITAAYAKSGQGRQADADRAATELAGANSRSCSRKARC